MKAPDRSLLPAAAVLAAALGSSLALFAFLPSETAWALREEGGPIELLTVALYVSAASGAALSAARGRWRNGWAGAAVLLIMALRELDVHSRFTGRSVTGTRFWMSHEASLPVKGVALLAIAAAALVLVLFLRRTVPGLLGDLRDRRPYALSVAAAAAVVPLTLILDQIPRPLKRAGLWTDDLSLLLSFIEEITELAMPLLFALALLQRRRELMQIRRSGQGRDTSG